MMKIFVWFFGILLVASSVQAEENIDQDIAQYMHRWSKTVPLSNRSIVAKIEKCANKGISQCAFALGRTYSKDIGSDGYLWTAQNKLSEKQATMAEHWFKIAAEKGHIEAMLRLGTLLFIYGKNKTLKERGIIWLKKATKAHNLDKSPAVMAARKLSVSFKNNILERNHWLDWLWKNGFDIDKDQILDYLYSDFRDASKALFSYNWLKKNNKLSFILPEHEKILSFYAQCVKRKHTKLYSVPLACAYRGEIAFALAAHGIKPKRVDYQYYYDEYNGKEFHNEASHIFIGYVHTSSDPTKTNRFARMEVEFKSSVDAEQLGRIKQFVSNVYGAPNRSHGNINVGNAWFEWNRPDGGRILVQRMKWPNTSVLLTIEVVEMARLLDMEISNNEKQTITKTSPFE